MQTFLMTPGDDFHGALHHLDAERLGKQRVEALQIINALCGRSKGWTTHPAADMWCGYEPALAAYHDACIDVWQSRGYRNNMVRFRSAGPLAVCWRDSYARCYQPVTYPAWLFEPDVARSHRVCLAVKQTRYYRPHLLDSDLPMFNAAMDALRAELLRNGEDLEAAIPEICRVFYHWPGNTSGLAPQTYTPPSNVEPSPELFAQVMARLPAKIRAHREAKGYPQTLNGVPA